MTASNIVPYQAPVPAAPASVLLPTNLTEGMRFAEMMATSRLVPVHLQKSPADCLLVIQQAMRWRLDPFAVAQATAVIHGKLMYEGKLVAAVVNSLGNLSKRLSYVYSGDGDNRAVVVSGTLVGETEPLTVAVRLKDARTDNKVWRTQPDQQLAYHGARVWARRYMPELMLGVYAPEEFPEPQAMRDVTPDAFMPPAASLPPPPPKAQPKPPLEVVIGDGWDPAKFPRTMPGLEEALEFIVGAVVDGRPGVVDLNAELLSTIAAKLPQFADRIARLRVEAAEAMAPKDDDTDEPDDDTFPGDRPSALYAEPLPGS